MKKKPGIPLTVGVFILFLTPLAVSAIMLRSAEKTNQFRPAEQDIVIAENGSKAVETQENVIEWSTTTNASGNYVAAKEIQVGEIRNPNGGYLRVRLVPTWEDASGCVVSGVEDVTDLRDAKIDGDTLLFKNSGDSASGITVNLDADWDTKWNTVIENGKLKYFESVNPVKPGDAPIKLVSSVEISDVIQQKAQEANIFLKIDVFADAIQTSGAAKNERWQ